MLLLCNKDQEYNNPLANFATCLCRQRIGPELSPESHQYGGFAFVQGARHSNLSKIPLTYIAAYFNLEGLRALFGGLSPPKHPVVTGLDRI